MLEKKGCCCFETMEARRAALQELTKKKELRREAASAGIEADDFDAILGSGDGWKAAGIEAILAAEFPRGAPQSATRGAGAGAGASPGPLARPPVPLRPPPTPSRMYGPLPGWAPVLLQQPLQQQQQQPPPQQQRWRARGGGSMPLPRPPPRPRQAAGALARPLLLRPRPACLRLRLFL